MARPLLRLFSLPAALALLACSSESPEAPSEQNHAPTWSDAPQALDLGEGQRVTVPVTVSDEDGDAVTLSVVASEGLEARVHDQTVELRADYGVVGGTVDVHLDDHRGEPVTVSLPVTVTPLSWTAYQSWTTDEGPEEREHPSMIVDQAGGQAFLFHGSGYHPQFEQMFDDVWRYDLQGGTWSQVTPIGDLPPATGSRRLAGAYGLGEGYLFGGYGPNSAVDNLLHRVRVEGDTLAFTLVDQVGAPPARALHSFAYDPGSDRYVLFGGFGGALLGDTWLMEIDEAGVAQWTELDLSPSPGPRYGAFSAFDEAMGRLIVFSGAQALAAGDPVNAAQETWVLDLRADPPQWSQLATGFTPPGRRNGSAVWDEPSSRLFVFGGTSDGATTEPGLFVLDARPGLESWHELALADPPPHRSSGTGFHDGDRAFFGFGNSNAIYRDWALLGY